MEEIDAEDSVPSANTSPTERGGDSEEEEEEEPPLFKRLRRERASIAAEASASEKVDLRDDGDSGVSSPGLKEPAIVEPINVAPPSSGKASFATFVSLEDSSSSEEDTG